MNARAIFLGVLLLCAQAWLLEADELHATVTGRVVERRSNEPMAGFQVELADGSAQTRTDEHGQFTLTGVGAGSHTIVVRVPEWGVFQRTILVDADSISIPVMRVWPDKNSGLHGVLAQYALNGNGVDDGPNGWDGVVDRATPTRDRFGNDAAAMFFEGRGSSITVAHQGRLNVLPLSISFWVRLDPACPSNCTITGKYLVPYGDGWAVFLSDDRMAGGYFTEFFRNSTRSHAALARDTRWHHVVYTMDSTAGVLFVDHARVPQVVAFSHPVQQTQNTFSFCIGTTLTDLGPRTFIGSIDDLYIFDHVLSDEEIEQLREGH